MNSCRALFGNMKCSPFETYFAEQKVWFWGVFRKDAAAFLFYGILFAFLLYYFPEDQVHIPPLKRQPHSHDQRIFLNVIIALLALVSMYINIFHGTPPHKGDVKHLFLRDNVNGHFGYLTVNILCVHVYYWPMCVLAELFRARRLEEDSQVVRKLIGFVYFTSILSGSFGIVLTILFLKFCWYEPKWRETVLELYQSRGFKWVGPKVLFLHVNQVFVSFLDVMVVKDKELLVKWTPSIYTIFGINGLIVVAYVVSVHINRFASNGQVPYPFLQMVLKSWKKEIIFIGAVAIFTNVCAMLLYFLVNLPA
uniref:Uncharacterized protein n=1 Tax=Aplanochytrium stocchinoi TaxID=215587 RepID=A0A7S3V0C6_9STRA|mmetsp:Transcript_5281/g.6662  ORF Transcript_5281/g.6662 Transcript_5281/m.6662 type:complete len:308 (-) Transcript_5281:1083-2006(-)